MLKIASACQGKYVTIPGTLGKRTGFKQMQMLRKIYELKNVNAFEDIRKYEKSSDSMAKAEKYAIFFLLNRYLHLFA